MKPLFSFLFILITLNSFAQTDAEINSDRPDQSDGTYIITKQKLQVENGITFQKNTLVNNLMLRYGITKSTEARLLVDAGKIVTQKGLLPVGISFKQRIIHEKKFLPAITLVGYYRLGKLATSDFKNSNHEYSLVLAFNHTLSNSFSVAYNLSSGNLKSSINTTFLVSYAPIHKLTCFAEYFSRFETHYLPQQNIDAGILYHINNNFQLDLAFGAQLFNNKNSYATTGFSYAF